MTEDSIIVKCKGCGIKNRIPRKRLNDRPVCGKCSSALPIEAIFDTPVTITDQTFYDDVISFPGPVVVDCWAPWCGPCKTIGPVLEQLAKQYSGRVKIAKLNVDQNPLIASQYAIQSIPTIIYFKNGKKVDTVIGAVPKSEIEKHMLEIM